MKFFIFTIISLSFGLAHGFHQELILHESEAEDGNYYVIRDNSPNASFLPTENIKRICFTGGWDLYLDANYLRHGDGSNTADVRCVNQTFPFQSFRHPGASDTEKDAVSLYPGTWAGPEVLVDEFPMSGNIIHVSTMGYTGRSAFTLFQGTQFDGPSHCLKANSKGFNWFVPSDHGLTTVGSIMKGCDMQ